jgi:hypothetical protein
MVFRSMTSRLAAFVILIGSVLAVAACGGGDGKAEGPASASPEPQSVATGELGDLQRRLERVGYPVELVEPNGLPRRAPEVSSGERRRKGLPKEARPDLGLRTQLPGSAIGYLYRYSSADLAAAIAPSFMGHVWGRRAVSGCGRNVFFARGGVAQGRAIDKWLKDTTAALRGARECSANFIVMG